MVRLRIGRSSIERGMGMGMGMDRILNQKARITRVQVIQVQAAMV
jgi:hypothetical protein